MYALTNPRPSLVGNELYTWELYATELGRELELPPERAMELLDRQGHACVTDDAPAVAVLAPFGPNVPLAVVLSNGRLIWREFDRGGAKSEYTAQLEAGEIVTAATWDVVSGDLLDSDDRHVQIMAFLGTSHGRVYRVGPLGAAAGGAEIASGPMNKPAGIQDYLPWRLRGRWQV